MQLATLLIAIYGTEFGQTQRQVLVTAGTPCEDFAVVGAVHGLEHIFLAFFGGVDGLETVLAIVGIVAAGHIQVLATNVRSDYLLIAITLLYLLEEVFKAETEGGSLGKPHGKSLTHTLREHEETHFLTNLTVVALLSFFKHLQILFKHLLLGEGDGIKASHLGTLLIATPVGRTYRKHLAGLDGGCIQHVRATAKVCERSLGVGGDVTIFQIFNQLVLICLATVTKELQGIGLADVLAYKVLLALYQLLHLLFNLNEIGLTDGNAFCRHYVIIESVFYGRTNTKLDAGIKFLQSFGHKVGTGMPKSMLALGVLPFVENHRCVLMNGAVEFHRLSIHATSQHVLCKTL